jgi:hypothetical protein
MTEQQWRTSTDPLAMLRALPSPRSDRKGRLFLCAAWHVRAQRFLKSGGMKPLRAIAHAESYADGVIPRMVFPYTNYSPCQPDPFLQAEGTILTLASRPRLGAPAEVLCHLLSDIFIGPFPIPMADPAWLNWNNRVVATLTQSIYYERAFGRLPVLADALEAAGCVHAGALQHCRSPGPHVRGCWVIDWILAKN